MKKFLTSAFVVAVLMSSCKKNEDEVAAVSLDGTWQIESISINGVSGDLGKCEKEGKIVFVESIKGYTETTYEEVNGVCNPSDLDVGTYEISGDKITMTPKLGGEAVTFSFSVSGNKLTISGKEKIEGNEVNFSKTLVKK